MTYEPLDSLHDHVVVVTGTLGSIATATANRLAARGARIVGITRRDLDLAQYNLDQLPNAHLEHLAVLADVTDCDQVKQAVGNIRENVGRCNILINTIGKTTHIPYNKMMAMTDDLFDQVLQDNLRCYYTVIREFVPLMQETSEGLIVNIGSAAARTVGAGSNLAYRCAKAGLDSLTRNLSRILAPGIRVMGVSPGALDNDFVPNKPENFVTNVTDRTPLQRIGTAEDIAATIEGLATLSRFMTGTIITVDGGTTLW